MFACAVVKTPLADLIATFYQDKLVGIAWGKQHQLQLQQHLQQKLVKQPFLFKQESAAALQTQMDAYFAGDLQQFVIPLRLVGTPFQLQVWQAVQQIPYGEVRAYRDIGVIIGSAGYRAVGNAVKHNPIPIVVPCHRVVASNGPGGYSMGNGLETKRALLRLEGAI